MSKQRRFIKKRRRAQSKWLYETIIQYHAFGIGVTVKHPTLDAACRHYEAAKPHAYTGYVIFVTEVGKPNRIVNSFDNGAGYDDDFFYSDGNDDCPDCGYEKPCRCDWIANQEDGDGDYEPEWDDEEEVEPIQ